MAFPTSRHPQCKRGGCTYHCTVERVTPTGQVRYSPWCRAHRESELLALAFRRQAAAEPRQAQVRSNRARAAALSTAAHRTA